MSKTYNIPQEAAMGYAETLYPEYRKKLKATHKAPNQCTRYCCGWLGFEGLPASAPGLRCIIGGGYSGLDQELLKSVPRWNWHHQYVVSARAGHYVLRKY